jgi:hypothetical protein
MSEPTPTPTVAIINDIESPCVECANKEICKYTVACGKVIASVNSELAKLNTILTTGLSNYGDLFTFTIDAPDDITIAVDCTHFEQELDVTPTT